MWNIRILRTDLWEWRRVSYISICRKPRIIRDHLSTNRVVKVVVEGEGIGGRKQNRKCSQEFKGGSDM